MTPMDVGDVVVAVLVVVGVLVVLGLGVIGVVMYRYRVPPRAVVAMVSALVYLASPVDVLPEVLLGPLGLVDDAGVVTAVGLWVYKIVRVRQRLREAGVERPPRRPGRG